MRQAKTDRAGEALLVNPATRLTEEPLKSIVEYRHKLFLKEVVKIRIYHVPARRRQQDA